MRSISDAAVGLCKQRLCPEILEDIVDDEAHCSRFTGAPKAEPSRSATVPMKRCHWLLLAIVLSSLALGLSLLTHGQNWGGDFAGYILQAQSIAGGGLQSFVERNTFAVRESSAVFGPVAYPWGFPLLLSPLVLVFGLSLLPFKLLGLAFFIAFLVAAFLLFEPRLGCRDATLLVAVLGFSPMLLRFNDNVLSDVPFLFLSTTALVVMDRALVLPKKLSSSISVSVLLGFLLFAASFVRSNGLLLLPTLLVINGVGYWRLRHSPSALSGKNGELLSAAVPYIVLATLFIVSSAVFPEGGSSHIELLALRGKTILHNMRYYLELPSDLFRVFPIRQSALLIYGMCMPFLLVGIIRTVKRDYHFAVYAALTLITYVLWPYVQGVRFLFPVLPLFIYFVFEGMRHSRFALANVNHRLGMALTYAFWVCVLALFFVDSTRAAVANLRSERARAGPFDSGSREMFDHMSAQTGAGVVVGFFKPRVMRMMTDRDAVLLHEVEALCRADYYVHSKRVSAGSEQIQADQLEVQSSVGKLRQVWENEGFTIYRTVGCAGGDDAEAFRVSSAHFSDSLTSDR